MELAGNQAQRPLITFYGSDGERIELSARTVHNWQCKLANLYRNQYGIDQTSTVQVRTFPHWALAPIVAAIGWVGATVMLEADRNSECTLTVMSEAQLADLPPTGDVTVASRSPLAEPMTTSLPIGVDDLYADVRMQPDQFGRPICEFPGVAAGGDAGSVGPAWQPTQQVIPGGQRPLVVGWQGSDAPRLIQAVSFLPCATGTPIVWIPDPTGVDVDRVRAQERTDVLVEF